MQCLLSWSKTDYFWCRQLQLRLRELLWARKPQDYKQTPIIINNFNRLDFLRRLIERLERDGYRNIYIIDNASGYDPLLAYYDCVPYPVFRL